MGVIKGMSLVNTEVYHQNRNLVLELVKDYNESKDINLLGLAASIHLDGRTHKGKNLENFPNVREMYTEAMSGKEREGVVFSPSYFNNENGNGEFPQYSHWAILHNGQVYARVFLRDYFPSDVEDFGLAIRRSFEVSGGVALKIYNSVKKFKLPS